MLSIDEREGDPRAAQMLRMFTHTEFARGLEYQRLQLILIYWIIRAKVSRNLKRLLDISLAIVALAFCLPIMVITTLAILLESGRPILFRQVRVGKWGQSFVCYKFRSMHVDAERQMALLKAQNEADGPVFKMKRDPRVTKVGRIIRKLSIDELPQLFNVLKGEMSLVGPRPALPTEVAQYTYDQVRRLHASPGITGLQQVSGRSNLDFQRWVELDLQYIAEQSLWKDVTILLKTIPAVLWSKGAY